MAINWDEVRKKANDRGKTAEQQIKAIHRPAVPAYTPPKTEQVLERKLPTASDFRNAPAQTSITAEQQAKNTQTFLTELKSKQGSIAAGAAGVGTGLTGGGKQYMAPETRQEIESKPALNRAFTGGQIAGSIPQFAAPYAAASKPITAAVSRLPAIAKMSPVAQKITGSVATDLTVGLPLNVNYALNAEGLRGKDALKSIALNTGIDVATGGLIEGLPAAARLIRNADNRIPVLQPNGKVSYVDAPTLPRATTPAPLPRATQTTPQNTPAQAPSVTVQPRNPEKGIEIPKEQPFAKNGDLKSVGADTFKGEKSVDELVNEYGAMPKGERPRAREIDIPKKTDYGDTQQYARTLQESAIVDDTLFKDINDAISQGSFTKSTKANKTAVDDASRTLEYGLDDAVTKFRSVLTADKQATSYDIALGNRVLQELQKQGRYSDAVDVAIDLSQMLSETGRTLQAARIAKRLSPEGRLMMVTRAADKVSKKTGTKVNLSDDTVEQISKATTEKEIVEANQKAAKEIWDQVPANWVDKVNSWRYTAMLFNPKTHVRNIVGNTIFVPVREFKNLLGAGLERVMVREGERTKAVLNPIKDKALIQFANSDFGNVKALLKNEGKIDDSVRSLDAKVFNTRALEGIRKFNLGALDAEDTWFMQAAYDSSLAQYMKANKLMPDKMVGDTLEKARSYAMNEALKATYRDFNSLANLISRGKAAAASGKYGPLGRAGGIALEGAIPFSKTPLNIIKRGVGYSPANIVRGVVNLGRVKSGKVTATEAIDQLASGLSGTALMGLGTWLGYNNLVTGKEGDYKDKLYNYNQMLGSQNYSLNIDGKSYTLDWAAPLSMPFFVGVELAKAIKDNNADLAAVLDAMTQISDPMVNLSMLKGINDIVKTNMAEGFEGMGKIGLNIATGYLGQYVPTLGGQIARTADDTRRSTISTAETPLERELGKFGRKQAAKLPMASKQLEPYVDLWGREQKNGNVAENFLSPGYFKQENITPVDRELQSLISKLDEENAKLIVPTSTAYEYELKSNSVPYRMTEKESTVYQKTRGQESFNGLNKLFASAEYRRMNDDEKVKAIQNVYSAAGQKAKYEYFDNKGLPVTLALSTEYQEKYEPVKHLISDKQFYAAVQSIKGVSKDIEKAYAIETRLPKANDKLYASLGISAESVSRARSLKQNRITVKQYQTALTAANTNGNDNVSKAEAMAYLDSSNLDMQQKYALMKALVPSLKDQNNPYR
jgi:hypothetical protein